MDRYCPNCKAKIEDSKKFCGNCGFKISDCDDVTTKKPKRNNKFNIVIAICAIVCIIIVAYVGSQLNDDNHLIVGRWEEVGNCWMDELEFFSDGTYSSDKDNYFGSYTIEDGRIRLGGVLMSDLVYSYKLDGDTLILYKKDIDDGDEYRRVK